MQLEMEKLIAAIIFIIPLNFCGRAVGISRVSTENIVGYAGKNISLPCPGLLRQTFVTGVEWRCNGCMKDNFQFTENDVLLYRHDERSSKLYTNEDRLSVDPESFSLVFSPLIYEDSGEYICLINEQPNPEKIIKFLVKDIPGPPSRPMVLTFDSRSVNLSWMAGEIHNSPVSHYLIYRKTGEYGTWDNENPIITENNDTIYHVRNLNPFTIYSFRISAVNDVGRSQLSPESFFIITLREAPTGKPVILAAYNVSTNAIRLNWSPPPIHTINGELLGYKISYKQETNGAKSVKEIFIHDFKATSYTIKKLMTYTKYLISIRVVNPEGSGPDSTVSVMTDEGVPTQPRNVSVANITGKSVEVTWNKPEYSNGIILGYRLYFLRDNLTDVRSIRNSSSRNHILTGLKPFSEYKIWLKAFTWKNEGDPSSHISIRTDTSAPHSPTITNLTCLASGGIVVEWSRPSIFYGSIDYYYVLYRKEDDLNFTEIILKASADWHYSKVQLLNLSTYSTYEIRIQGGSRSIYNDGVIHKGDPSFSRKFFVQETCESFQKLLMTETFFSETNAGIIAGIICGIFALISVALAFIVWRKCFYESYYYIAEDERKPTPVAISWNGESDLEFSIPVYLFPIHVAKLHADEDIGFSKEYAEFRDLNLVAHSTSFLSQQPQNKTKNRYMNILAYDHTRVVLKSYSAKKRNTQYINANYIDGFNKNRAYIATQGPLPSTFEPFWQMIWENNVRVIVMITNLEERGKKKCDLYWPKQSTERYGVIQVKMDKETILATYTVRQFSITHLKVKCKKTNVSERTVYQYHYTNWPDHGAPEHPLLILNFVRVSSAVSRENCGPIVVHCSAGVGRTGAYIVIDAMLQQIKAHGKLNIYGFLKHIRSQRNYLVQTVEQYIFIHDVLLEAILCGETSILVNDFHEYIRELHFPDVTQESNQSRLILESQYKLVTLHCPSAKDFQSALSSKNIAKNRSTEIIPVEENRVYIMPKLGIEGSDYINASWILGYNKLHEFIVTQHPLVDTVYDFWQMVWDHNAQTIVLLSENDGKKFSTFWPTTYSEIEYENYKIVFNEELIHPNYTVRDFTMQSLEDDYEMNVRMIHKASWIHFTDVLQLFSLIRVVQDNHLHYQNGPIVVVDNYGGTEAATFCCLMTLFKQLREERHVNVYMYAKLYHESRPGVWSCQVFVFFEKKLFLKKKSQDDYFFLYRAIDIFLRHASTRGKHQQLRNYANSKTEAEVQLRDEESTFRSKTVIL